MRSSRTILPIVLLLCVLTAKGLAAQQQDSPSSGPIEAFTCDRAGVRLEGLLIRKWFYGPPGFGETPGKDAKEQALILRLAAPISVHPAKDAAEKNSTCLEAYERVRDIQLFVNGGNAAVMNLVGKRVIVEGTLEESPAPAVHTDVIMDAQAIRAK